VNLEVIGHKAAVTSFNVRLITRNSTGETERTTKGLGQIDKDATVYYEVTPILFKQLIQKVRGYRIRTFIKVNNINPNPCHIYYFIPRTSCSEIILIWGPLSLLSKLLPDLITGIQNTAFCQENGIQSERTRDKF
jgi:hypothetical protein